MGRTTWILIGFAFGNVALAAACSGDSSGGNTTTTTGTGGTGAHNTGGSAGGLPAPEYDCTPATGALPALVQTDVATGLDRPVLALAAPGDDTRLFIVEQPGRIRIVENGALLPTPFLDISARVNPPGGGDERGLLGLAFHPRYQQNGRFFLYYTDRNQQGGSSGDQHLAEFARTPGDPNSANPASERTLAVLPDFESNHNGGMIAFGADGMLYIGLGDGGGGDDQHGAFGNGQNLGTLWGKIARIDVDSATQPYGIPSGNISAIPAGNPTTDPLLPEIWDYGLRNPYRFSFDPCTGDLYIGDVGQNAWEEIDVEPAGQGRKNYGWRSMEGKHCFDANLGCEAVEGYTPPVLDYPHGGECSVTGGFVYRSSAIPALRGTYIFGDYCSGTIWSTQWSAGVATPMVDMGLANGGSLSGFGSDNFGNVYVCYLDGRVTRIDAQ